MATVDSAIYNLEALPLKDLKRLYESYYGHKTSLSCRETLCRSVAKKAVSLHKPRPRSAGVSQMEVEYNRNGGSEYQRFSGSGGAVQAGSGARSVVQNYTPAKPGMAVDSTQRWTASQRLRGTVASTMVDPTTSFSSNSGRGNSTRKLISTSKASHPQSMIRTADGKMVPHYMLNSKDSGSAWFEKCVKTMGISVTPPRELITSRGEGRTADGVVPWATRCAVMSNRMMKRYSGKLCKAGMRGAESSSRRGSLTKGQPRPSAERNNEVAQAEWKLHRGVEQGPVYLFHVWSGVKRTTLEAECAGIYRILSPVMIESLLEERRRLTGKQKRLRRLNGVDDSQVDEAAQDAAEALRALEEGAVEGEEGSDFEEVPYCTVVIDHNNLLQMRVYFGKNQLNDAVPSDTMASPYAFSCEAACINVDKWFGLTGPWKNKVIFFSREKDHLTQQQQSTATTSSSSSLSSTNLASSQNMVEAFFVDGFCFEKAYTENPCSVADPFQCSVCGSVRRGNNFIYADSGAANLQRGRYFCAVCKKKQQHVSLSEESRQLRPRWNPTPARSMVEYPTLNDPPALLK